MLEQLGLSSFQTTDTVLPMLPALAGATAA
jgi:hypothetical protein